MKYSYKESNIEWLGLIPEHWKIDRIKDRCEKVTGGGTPKSGISEYWDEGEIIWISPTDFSKSEKKIIKDSEKKITPLGLKKSSANLLPIGTVIMSSRASIGEVKIAGKELSTNQGFVSFLPQKNLYNNFLYYVIKGFLGEYFSEIASGTTFMEISRRMVQLEKIPLPPLPEQKAIAAYLDQACARIDRIIEIKERQLESNQKYYVSKLHELITKGSIKVKLKSSEIEWQGNVPVHWKKEKLFRLANKMGSGGTPKSTNQLYYNGDIPWIQSGDLNDGLITKTKKTITENAIKESSAKLFEEGTVLIAMYGATIGKLGVMGMDAATNQACCAIQPGPNLVPNYLFFLLYDMREYLISRGYGGGQNNISQEVIKQQYFYYPPLKEQNKIVQSVETLQHRSTAIKIKLQSQIKTLKNYRKSLIHECVTGKKQVFLEIEK
jgi:type I restriction enzyme S subunit